MQQPVTRPEATAGAPRGSARAFSNLAALAAAAGLWAGLVLGAPAAWSQEKGLTIELNKVEDFEGGCMASFVFHNRLGHTLDRFNLDLILFDKEGVILRRLMIDLAPLRDGKTRVAQFRLHDEGCAEVSRVLVNDIPQCRAEGGEELDCVAGLGVLSRSDIELAK